LIEVIRTERLELRPLVADDAEDLAELLDEATMREWLISADVAALRARFARWESRRSPGGDAAWLNWVVRRRDDDDGAAVGWVQATVAGGSAEIAYAMVASARRLGYGAEAIRALVDWLDVTSVEAHIAPPNEGSAAVARAAGLRPTSELHDGEVVWRRRR
jgi:RimJ/RimL family protein N-acetyltransferase